MSAYSDGYDRKSIVSSVSHEYLDRWSDGLRAREVADHYSKWAGERFEVVSETKPPEAEELLDSILASFKEHFDADQKILDSHQKSKVMKQPELSYTARTILESLESFRPVARDRRWISK